MASDKQTAISLWKQGFTYKEIAETIDRSETWCKVTLRDTIKSGLDIPWKYLEDRWNYATMSRDGTVRLYEKEPMLFGNDWVMQSDSATVSLVGLLKIDTFTVKWQQSLTKRVA